MSLAFTRGSALASPIGHFLPHIEDLPLISAHMLYELSRKERSPYYPYLAALPSDFNTPLTWPLDLIFELSNTSTGLQLMWLRHVASAAWNTLQESMDTFSEVFSGSAQVALCTE